MYFRAKRNKQLSIFGQNFGMAFQIKDDLFDLLMSEKEIGKDIENDVKKSMITLPYIYSFRTVKKSEQKRMNSLLRRRKKSPKHIHELKELIKQGGGFNYAYEKIDEFSNIARDALNFFGDSPYKNTLIELLHYNKHRKR